MKKNFQKIFASRYWWVLLLVLFVAVNFLAADFHARFDLTKEKRYTLSKATRSLLLSLDDDLSIDVFLKGDFPAGFHKLANSTEEFLQLMKDRNGSKIHYRFLSPQDLAPGTQIAYGDSLTSLGAIPINLTVQKKEGESRNIIYAVALMHYHGKQALVNLYPGAAGKISQQEINSAEALMEYQFVKTLDGLMHPDKTLVAYLTGNGEPADYRTYDLQQILQQNYQLFTFNINSQKIIPDTFKVLLMVKPSVSFSDEEKLKLDQYIMRGGKILCFIDNLIAEQDSLRSQPETIAYDRNLNLTDLFFRYGARINTDLVMDLQCELMPFAVGGTAEKPQYEFLHWNYYPVFEPNSNHTITKNTGFVAGKFVNSIDTVTAVGIKKTVLLASSANSRTISTPALISLNENRNTPEDEKFRKSNIPVAVLLEGKFTSLYRNRIGRAQTDSLAAYGVPFLESAPEDNKMIIVSDGDIVLNDISPQDGPLKMGVNIFTLNTEYDYQFANRDFLQNCIEYLVNKPGIIETRNKDIVLRLLDSKKVNQQKTTWQFVNIALPVLLVILFGLIYQFVRKKKYTR